MGSKVCEDEGDGKLCFNNFWRIVSSHSKTLFPAMNLTTAINTNCEIEINITIHTPALLSICQHGYYQVIFIAKFISLLCRFHRRYVHLFYHDICSFFYSHSNTSEILQLYTCLHLNAYYNQIYTNINFMVVLIKILTI